MSCRLPGLIVVALLGILWLRSARAAPLPPALPFVACPSDGQSGPLPPPEARPAIPRIPGPAIDHLALYASGGMAVLAPRNWHCIEVYGSDGATLLVTPRRYTMATLPDFGRLAGPAVELSFINGENSGRDQVAEVFSRLFRFKRAFIQGVASGYDDPTRYPHGPYPTDTTVRRSRARVDYTTPPHRQGMGTYESRLGPGANPIMGRASLAHSNGVDSVVLLNVRLPPRLRVQAPVILRTADTSAWSRGEP